MLLAVTQALAFPLSVDVLGINLGPPSLQLLLFSLLLPDTPQHVHVCAHECTHIHIHAHVHYFPPGELCSSCCSLVLPSLHPRSSCSPTPAFSEQPPNTWVVLLEILPPPPLREREFSRRSWRAFVVCVAGGGGRDATNPPAVALLLYPPVSSLADLPGQVVKSGSASTASPFCAAPGCTQ